MTRKLEHKHLPIYDTNKVVHKKIDDLLFLNAKIECNLGLDSTDKERAKATREKRKIELKIKALDELFWKIAYPPN